ncbi:neuraminidase-like domain-containing protein [Leptolyngbya sp. FACHB-711]|uniref:neuraminidase-like domain-containing protein n=1 Tax=Leptolyngbya sp. FACHB-711 TaxID=2692813 RepID=UPI001685AB63|nr:neuraminidase-like domain-containing protein [Leptolyngbya sp. FACHB-711]MBD2026807.1 hypothetical protein [Leptolyngbya sp. FACHB-711]
MNKIVFPLVPNTSDPTIADLQDALQLFLDRLLILPNEEGARRELSQGLRRERSQQFYGDLTQKLVSIFQEERQLQSSGAVDEATAKAMNALLQQLGMLDETSEQTKLPQFVVSGEVRREDGLPLQNLRVRAVHEDDRAVIRLGEDTIDAEGRYTIRYEPLPEVADIHLRVSVVDEAGQLLHSSDVVQNAKSLEVINVIVPIAKSPDRLSRIEGQIIFENGSPAEQLQLRLYRREFGEQQAILLSRTTTLTGGKYAFSYSTGGRAASLEVRAVRNGNEEITLSKPLNYLETASSNVVNLVAPSTLQSLDPEYQRLSSSLKPIVNEIKKLAEAKENGNRQDLTVLNRATGWDARLIALAATTEKLAVDPEVSLPNQVIYGLLRAGLPSDKLMLAQVSPAVAKQALKAVQDGGIVELEDAQVQEFEQQFTTFADKVRLNLPAPGSRSTYGDLLKSSGLSEGEQRKFASVYLNHRGDAAELWEKARSEVGLDAAQISKLQLQGKLAFLTGNSEKLTAQLQQKIDTTNPTQLVEQDFYQIDRWIDEINAIANIPMERRDNLTEEDEQQLAAVIPPLFAAETVEVGRQLWAEDMARKVRLSYPTQVVGRLVEQDNADQFKLGTARTATATLLNNAATQGFRLGQTPVEAYFNSHVGVRGAMTDAEFETAKQEIKTLQRIYQITPTNEAMPVLTSLGMTSAYDVMAYPEEAFSVLFAAEYLKLYGRNPSQEETRLVYRKAKQVSSVTYNLFAIAKKLDSDATVQTISGTPQQRVEAQDKLKGALKDYPTLESLFGSMDFCECEHCRSVLSPAAYLVDLLQFIDAEPDVWGNFLVRWKDTHDDQEYTVKYKNPYDVLIDRRPDLPHIPLTCENTHTALPYIDVVNEILEYYVANDRLTEQAARDTGDTPTAELLAEPQNVIREAYDKLGEARYPLTLPFDLWLETVRQFCQYFETPLSHLLEVLRRSDALFAPQQPFDRASLLIESLGISPAELAIFSDPNPLPKWYELYGFQDAAAAKNEAIDEDGQRIDLNSAKALSRRLRVTYKELVETIQTEFVNPELNKLTILYGLGVSIQSVQFCRDQQNKTLYEQNRDLLDKERNALSEAEQQRFDALSQSQWKTLKEVQSFEQRLQKFAEQFKVQPAQVKSELDAIPFDQILVLADPDAGCNFDLTTVRYANGDAADDMAFLKVNLFVRLWRKLGWTIAETDRALVTFLPKNAPFKTASLNQQPLKTALIYLAHLNALDSSVSAGKQSRLKLLTLWSDLATTGKNSLYSQLFLSRSLLQSDDVFDHPLGRYLAADEVAAMARSRLHRVQRGNVAPGDRLDPAQLGADDRISVLYDPVQEVQFLTYRGILSDEEKNTLNALLPESDVLSDLLDAVQIQAQAFSLIKGHLLALQGALGLTTDEIDRILKDSGKSIDTAELSLAHVSLLYRYQLLAKALDLSILEFIAIKQLSGLDPFRSLHPEPPTKIEEDYPLNHTLRLVEIVQIVRQSGFQIEDLKYLLRHQFDETGKYRSNSEATLTLLKTLAEGIFKIRAEHILPDDPGNLSDEVMRQKLGLIFPPNVVERLLSMMNGTAEFTVTKEVAVAAQLNPLSFVGEPAISQLTYNATKQEQKLVFRGVLFDAQQTELQARFNASLTSDQRETLTKLLDQVKAKARQDADAFFVKHLKKQPLNASVSTGFLRTEDFEVLFAPLPEIQDSLSPADKEAAIKANEARRKQKIATLAKAFLPFLQQSLIRQFIVQTLTAQTGSDPSLVESLLTDDRLLNLAQPSGEKQPLLVSFTAPGDRGVNVDFFSSDDCSGDRQATAFTVVSPETALKDQRDKDGNPLPVANSARFQGYLEVPASGAYRFYVVLDQENAEATLRFDDLPQPQFLNGAARSSPDEIGDGASEYLELKPGLLYRFTLELKKLNGRGARLLVQSETLPKDSLSQLKLYPLTAIKQAERATLLLTKSLQLIQGFGISERELRYLLTHAAQFDNLALSQLPTHTSEDSPDRAKALFSQFLRLAGYAHLKRDLAGGTDDLIGIFEANETALSNAYPLIARLMRRDEATVKATAKLLFEAPNFASEKPLQRLRDALQVVERFGVSPVSLFEWTYIVNPATPSAQRFLISRNLKEAIKARFETDGWQRIAKPIFDQLRQQQRDALVAHIMTQQHFDRMEQLYEYFLIDPGMEPIVQTSRIRLAISSLQLFIQRCLLNLEKQVHPSAIVNANHWEWMKRYRVWEANRKIFLFPENWLEPEFRDDKTHLFTELEGALLQGDVSSDLVEDAFLNYLRKLEQLARLDIVAMHLEDKNNPAQNRLHVIGRTYSQPHQYFYRRYAEGAWTPWEPISAEIEGNHLAPVIWRDRLCLFWVTFMEKAKENKQARPLNPTQSITIPEVATELEAQLHWSEYVQGRWTTRESSNIKASEPQKLKATAVDPNGVFIHVSKEPYENGEERGVFVHLGSPFNQAFYLAGRNSLPERRTFEAAPAHPYSPKEINATRYSGDGSLTVTFAQRIATTAGSSTQPPETRSILQLGGNYTLLPCNNNILFGAPTSAFAGAANPEAVKMAIESGRSEIASLMKPIFYQDNAHTLFIEPNVIEQTIEEWQEWVTQTTIPGSGSYIPPGKDFIVIPEIPKVPIPEVLIPDRGDPPPFAINPEGIYKMNPGQDWLVNPATALVFEGEFIGAAGRVDLAVLPVTEVAATLQQGGDLVSVHTGSEIAAGNAVVLSEGATLERTGMVQVASGLNVVGSSGFNSALAQNLEAIKQASPRSFNVSANRFAR